MRIVVALGGNALLRRGQKPDAEVQERNVATAVASLAPLADEHELVITHGNGPQVGVLALQSASDPNLTTPYPFDVLGAQTQGMIGYWLLQSMQNALPRRQVAAIINQTLVEAGDPAFRDPTKFVGQVYGEQDARRLAADRGWTVKPDGEFWRRVVGSPTPKRVVETRLIRLLLESGAIVICAGGGGVPMLRNSPPRRIGKNSTSAPHPAASCSIWVEARYAKGLEKSYTNVTLRAALATWAPCPPRGIGGCGRGYRPYESVRDSG